MRTNTLIHRGLTFTVQHARDDDHDPPWEDGDGRGVVTEWINTSDDQRERDGIDYQDRDRWRVLQHDGGRTRYFDQAATLAKAIEEGWGVADPPAGATPEEIIGLAVEREYQFLNGWCSDDWEYIGVVVTLEGTKISRSLWGIESNEYAYLDEVARELADQIIGEGIGEIEAEMARLNDIRASLGAVTPVPAEGGEQA